MKYIFLIAVVIAIGWVLLHLSGRDKNGLLTATDSKITSKAEERIAILLEGLRDDELIYRDKHINDLGFCGTASVTAARDEIASLYSYFDCRIALDGTEYVMYAKLREGYYCFDIRGIGKRVYVEPDRITCGE